MVATTLERQNDRPMVRAAAAARLPVDEHVAETVSPADDRSAQVCRLRPAQRIWLQKGEAPPFGRDAYELLLCVAESGSLAQGARRAGVSYSKALHLVQEAEECLGVRLFERRIGGHAGGGSTLTAAGRTLGERFGALLAAAETELAKLYEQYFGDLSFADDRLGARA